MDLRQQGTDNLLVLRRHSQIASVVRCNGKAHRPVSCADGGALPWETCPSRLSSVARFGKRHFRVESTAALLGHCKGAFACEAGDRRG